MQRLTPAKRGRGRKRRQPTGENWLDRTPAERHASMTWMQRLKRVFNIDIETCERCAGQVKIIVEASNRCIEDPVVIERILAQHLKNKEPSAGTAMLPEGGRTFCRGKQIRNDTLTGPKAHKSGVVLKPPSQWWAICSK